MATNKRPPVFQIAYPDAIDIITATVVQIFCFGTVTIIGGFVLLSRSGITIWRTARRQRFLRQKAAG
jgi:hypothetical protein